MRILAGVLALGAALSASVAVADTMANAQGNTIVVTYANGATADYYFNADHSFMAMTSAGEHIMGTYAVRDGQICFTPSGAEESCTAYVGDKNVGDTWTQTATDGSEISVTLRAGR